VHVQCIRAVIYLIYGFKFSVISKAGDFAAASASASDRSQMHKGETNEGVPLRGVDVRCNAFYSTVLSILVHTHK
jgi:hypothetical protein